MSDSVGEAEPASDSGSAADPENEKTSSAGRRLGVITIDNAVSGASNVFITVLAARALSVSSFGLFAIVFLAYVMGQGVSRALVNDPLLVHPVEAQDRPNDVIATSTLLSFGIAAVTAASGLVVRIFLPSLGTALLVLAACVPLLVLQDLGRYLGIATQRPVRALVLDTVWLVLVFATVAVLFIADARTLAWFITAWAGSGAVSGLLLFVQYPHYRPRLSLTWLKYTWSFSWRYLISYGSAQSTALIASAAVGGVAGSKALGSVQGTILLVRPFGTVQAAAVAAGVADISRANGVAAQIRRRALQITGFATGLAVINAAVMLVLPDRLGRLVLGATWHSTKPLLLPTAIQIVFLGVLTGGRAGLYGMRAVRRAVGLDVATAVVVLIATVSGVLINNALGALWAVAIGQGLLATAWWVTFVNQLGRHEPRPVEPEVEIPTPSVEGPLPTTSLPMA